LEKLLTRGQCADITGLSAKAIRYYEEQGLVSPQRNEAGYRLYGAKEIALLYQIKQLKLTGLGLREIKKLLLPDEKYQWPKVLSHLKLETERSIAKQRQQLEQIERLLAEEKPTTASLQSKLPDEIEEILSRYRQAFSHLPEDILAKYTLLDRKMLSLLVTLDWPEQTKKAVIANFKLALDHPEIAQKSCEFLLKFEEFATYEESHPEVETFINALQLKNREGEISEMELLFYHVLSEQLGSEISSAQLKILNLALAQ